MNTQVNDALPKNVFVYGTLKKGYGNHAILRESKFVKEDMLPISALSGIGFPFATFTDDPTAPLLKGEIYEVTDESTLRRLDMLEGSPDWYVRTETVTVSGTTVEVYDFPNQIQEIAQQFLVGVSEGRQVYEWSY